MFPSVANFLTYLRGLRPKNRIAGAFGSFGWGGGAVKEAYEILKKIGLETYEPGLEVLYRPSADDTSRCYDYGVAFAKKVKEYHKNFA
jgi:flavorubredoxin